MGVHVCVHMGLLRRVSVRVCASPCVRHRVCMCVLAFVHVRE